MYPSSARPSGTELISVRIKKIVSANYYKFIICLGHKFEYIKPVISRIASVFTEMIKTFGFSS